jgi:chemotaxis signal transduction protein
MQIVESMPHDAVAAHDDAAPARVQRMAVRVGEIGLLLPWDGGREVMPLPAASRLPNTVAWFHGIANVRGALVPVVDAATACGVARVRGAANYLLICGHGEAAMGLMIDGLPRVLDLDPSCRLPELPPVPALLDDSVVAAYEHEGQVWLEVTLEPLFDVLAGGIALAGRIEEKAL